MMHSLCSAVPHLLAVLLPNPSDVVKLVVIEQLPTTHEQARTTHNARATYDANKPAPQYT